MNTFLNFALKCAAGVGLVVISLSSANAQNVGISNTTITPDPSSLLELRSTDGGFLMPRMTIAQRNAIASPATGLIIYQTNSSPGYYFYNGTAWGPIEGVDNLGNHQYTQNMETDGNWLSGDGDNEGVYVDNSGSVGIGTASPSSKMDVNSPSNALRLRAGDVNNGSGGDKQIKFSYNGTTNYTHNIRTRHNSGSDNGNAIDFYLWDQGTDAVGADGTRHVMTLNDGKVGIGTTAPANELDVVGTTETEAIMITTGAVNGYVLQSDASGNATWVDPNTLPGAGDDLGDHLATQNIETDGNWLSNDGDNEGIFVATDGSIGVGTSAPTVPFHVQEDAAGGDFLIKATKNSNTVGELVGIGLGSQSGFHVVKSAMIHERESAFGTGKLHFAVDNSTDGNDVSISESRVTIDRYGKVGIGTTDPTEQLQVEGNIRIANGGYIDDDATLAGNNDDWLRLNGFVEMKSDNDDYGLVLRDKDNTEFLGLTQKNGWSYLSENTTSGNYFLRGSGANAEVRGDLTVRGGDVRDNSGSLRVSGEDDLHLTMDYNNNDADTRAIIFGKDNQNSPTELMRLTEAGDLGIGTSTPSEKLHVEGNGQVTGYMKVGNPASPQSSQSGQEITIYGWSSWMAYAGWTRSSTCGPGSADWVWLHAGGFPGTANYFEYDNVGARSRKSLHSPWMFIPTGATTLRVEAQFDCSLENNYDGVFLEYSTDGSTWTKVTGFSYHGYPDNAAGSNTSCNGNSNESCWNGNLSNYSCWTNDLSGSLAGSWVGFRLTGFEDSSVGSGDFRLYGFSVNAEMPSGIGGSFDAGNVYAENNVYAGSNVLLGDVAEYFPVNGASEAGDVISISKGGRGEAYVVSSRAYDDQVIGVYSTAPTVTLNDPNSGVPVGLRGRVPVKVTGANGAINVGDPITSSHIKGHAMKADRPCYIIGRALERFDGKGEGKVLCLLENGWFNPGTEGSASSSGSFMIKESQKSITVYDDAVAADSKVFLTLLGDPGHRFWISEKSEGSFTIELSGESLNEVPFDFLIENANVTAAQNDEFVLQTTEPPANIEQEGWKYDETKGVYWREEAYKGQKTVIPEFTMTTPPATPEDASKAYIFNTETNKAEVTAEVKEAIR